MIRRFSLYGFLKNQRYYEPFIILFFLQHGLSFTQIGFLIGFREVCINLFEIPSGAIADLYGRRRSMMLSFLSYIAAFALFGFGQAYWHFFIAMFFFAIGEAFRTGTHKAMIFTWLRLQGRLDEKTKVYGYTRSWSKLGSAFSIILATGLVLLTNNYTAIFFFSIVPYLLGLLNIMTYPKELEGQPSSDMRLRNIFLHLWDALLESVKIKRLRRLIVESMAFEGVFKAIGDYLQPILGTIAILLPVFLAFGEFRRTAIIAGTVYFILHLASAYASRNSYRVAEYMGSEEKGSHLLWRIVGSIYIVLIPLLFFEWYYIAVIGFIGLHIIQNFWRPIQISRFDSFATETKGATILSIESQAKSVSTMIVAPLMGWAVDMVLARNLGGEFWPVGAIAASVSIFILISSTHSRKDS
ncbi:MAG: MFS transporter [Chloroflexota bacterium]|nr:MFS transporter [Chloroflexota bacterium]